MPPKVRKQQTLAQITASIPNCKATTLDPKPVAPPESDPVERGRGKGRQKPKASGDTRPVVPRNHKPFADHPAPALAAAAAAAEKPHSRCGRRS